MKFAFLFLTYSNIRNYDVYKKFIGNDNLYIHPKYADLVNSEQKKYVINDIVETKWCDISGVLAIIKLLEESYKNKLNEHFILLSEDSYPLFTKELFLKKFNGLDTTKSFFDYWHIKNNLYNSATWWILVRKDVEVILKNKNKYLQLFKSIKKLLHCDDETFFLTLLMNENKNYQYNIFSNIYTKWNKYIISGHPIIFGKLLNSDIKNIDNSNSFFIRKVLDNFSLNELKHKKNLYIITIGIYTNIKKLQLFLNKNKETSDFICFSFINYRDIDIKCDWVYIYDNINFKSEYDNILGFFISYYNDLHKWNNGIYIIPEEFDYNSINLNKINNYILYKINYMKEYKYKLNYKLYIDSISIINKINFYKLCDNKNNMLLYVKN
jgi:hypothetical protein